MPKKKPPKYPKKKPSRPVPPDAPRKRHPPRVSTSEALAVAADEKATLGARRARGAKHIAEDREQPIAERRKAAAMYAKIEYVTDPEQHSLQWHYERADRPFTELWPKFKMFDGLALREEWKYARDTYWTEIQMQVQKKIQRADVEALARDTKRFSAVFDAMIEYVEPMCDEHGVVLRHGAFLADGVTPHPYHGRPIMPLEMPSLDKFVPVMLKLHDKLQGNRALIAGRPQMTDDDAVKASSRHDAKIPISDAMVEVMTRAMLREAREKMGDFDVDELPETAIGGDEEVEDEFGADAPAPGNG